MRGHIQAIELGYILEFLPGKRALAIGLCVYHSVVSTVLFQAPRFIPYSFGAFIESSVILAPSAAHIRRYIYADPRSASSRYNVTPEIVWGCMHGFLGLGFVAWWQGTVAYMQMAKRTE